MALPIHAAFILDSKAEVDAQGQLQTKPFWKMTSLTRIKGLYRNAPVSLVCWAAAMSHGMPEPRNEDARHFYVGFDEAQKPHLFEVVDTPETLALWHKKLERDAAEAAKAAEAVKALAEESVTGRLNSPDPSIQNIPIKSA